MRGKKKERFPKLHGAWNSRFLVMAEGGSEQLLWQKNPPHEYPSRQVSFQHSCSATSPYGHCWQGWETLTMPSGVPVGCYHWHCVNPGRLQELTVPARKTGGSPFMQAQRAQHAL